MRYITYFTLFLITALNCIAQNQPGYTLNIDKINGVVNESKLAYNMIYHLNELESVKLTKVIDSKIDASNKTNLKEVVTGREKFYMTTFSAWCAPCMRELLTIGRLVQEPNNRIIFLVMGSEKDSNEESVKKIRNIFRSDCENVEIFIVDGGYNYFSRYIPEAIIYERGSLKYARNGYRDSKNLPLDFLRIPE